ncbi:MAG: hypothetical protein KatS3mg053_3451 [Candidatus Roseilinea sp.]|nr:MAG: hypothetical protein KatS3mg053_3451 [Candidatus Roseilinea sp.]
MPCRAEFAAHCYYHIFNHSNNRAPIFYEREHFAFFLRTMRDRLRLELERKVIWMLQGVKLDINIESFPVELHR